MLKHPPPSAFGFMPAKAPITVTGSTLITPEKDISFTGSDVTITDSYIDVSGALDKPAEDSGNVAINGNGNITVNKGMILTRGNLNGGNIDIHGENDVNFSETIINTSALEKTGNISISGDSITVGNGSGIYAKNAAEGGIINISAKNTFELSGVASDGYPAEIFMANYSESGNNIPSSFNLAAKNVVLNESMIISYAMSAGDGGDINVNADNIISRGFGSGFFSSVHEPFSTGNGGDISINAGTIHFSDGAYINSTTYGMGNAGNINIISDDLKISGAEGWASSITAGAEPKPIEGKGMDFLKGGNGGFIDITAKNITLSGGGQIASSSIAQPGTESGKAGIINITADTVTATGVNPYGPNEDGYGSGIYARSFGAGADDAGRISINAGRINLTKGGVINTESAHKGGGVIELNVSDQLYLHGGEITTSVAQGKGHGGDVTVESNLVIMNRGYITAKADTGDGGAIFIRHPYCHTCRIRQKPEGNFFTYIRQQN